MSVVIGKMAIKALPGKENRAVKKASGTPISVEVIVTVRPSSSVLMTAERYFGSPIRMRQPERPSALAARLAPITCTRG